MEISIIQDKIDTTEIPLKEPIDAGFVKVFDQGEYSSDIVEDQIANEYVEAIDDSYPYQAKPAISSQRNRNLRLPEWLASGAEKLSKSLLTGLVAVQIDITRLSVSNQRTAPIDVAVIVNMCREYQSFVISVSPSLIMSRDKVHASSLLGPSGFLLTWLEMFEGEGNESE